jgi:hypothetical protein
VAAGVRGSSRIPFGVAREDARAVRFACPVGAIVLVAFVDCGLRPGGLHPQLPSCAPLGRRSGACARGSY